MMYHICSKNPLPFLEWASCCLFWIHELNLSGLLLMCSNKVLCILYNKQSNIADKGQYSKLSPKYKQHKESYILNGCIFICYWPHLWSSICSFQILPTLSEFCFFVFCSLLRWIGTRLLLIFICFYMYQCLKNSHLYRP